MALFVLLALLSLTSVSESAPATAVFSPAQSRVTPLGRRHIRLKIICRASETDLAVIGGGPGGYVAAIKAAQLGLSVTCIDARATLGGACLKVGCIPSKALLDATHKLHQAKHEFAKRGIIAENVRFDFPQMMKAKETTVRDLTSGIAGLFKKNKVTHVKGFATLSGPDSVEFALNGGGTQRISAKNILLATGAGTAPLPSVEIDEETILSSTGALSLKQIPQRLTVIGAGVIGLELGSVYARLGAAVTVVEYQDRIVPGLDAEIAKAFQKLLEKQSLKFRLGQKVRSATKTADSVRVQLNDDELVSDAVLVAIGRRPFTKGLGLERLGVKTDPRGFITVDEHWQTSVPGVYVIGDCIPGPMLAHRAEDEGVAVAEHLADRLRRDSGRDLFASRGRLLWQDRGAVERGRRRLRRRQVPVHGRARASFDADGFVKVLADRETGMVVGVHIIGPNAGEMIAEGCMAMQYGASPEEIARVCHAHPTLSEAFREAAMSAYEKPIHF